MQNGLGLLLKMLISSATQVIVFSPPESWLMLTGCLPGGRAMISMPASSDVDLLLVRQHQSGRRGRRSARRFLVFDFGFEEDVGFAAAEQLAEHALEMLADGVERLLEPQRCSRR